MGGGKAKKPLSVMDKEARKKTKETREQTKKAKEEKPSKRASLDLSDQLLERASKALAESKIATPSSLASSLGVKVSLARSVIRELIRSGKAVMVSKFRGVILARATQG